MSNRKRRSGATITISKREFRALRAAQERLRAIEGEAFFPAFRGNVSRIDRDPALAAFIKERLGRIALADIVAECRAKFGPERAPSRSAIQRFQWRLNDL